MLRRWFNWDANWKIFSGKYTTYKKIIQFRQRSEKTAAESRLDAPAEEEAPTAAPTDQKRQRDWILRDLRGQTAGSDLDIMAKVLANAEIQNLAEMVYYSKRPLFKSHVHTLHQLEKIDTAVQWHSDRAHRHWEAEIRETLGVLMDTETLERIKVKSAQDTGEGRAGSFVPLTNLSIAGSRDISIKTGHRACAALLRPRHLDGLGEGLESAGLRPASGAVGGDAEQRPVGSVPSAADSSGRLQRRHQSQACIAESGTPRKRSAHAEWGFKASGVGGLPMTLKVEGLGWRLRVCVGKRSSIQSRRPVAV